MAKLVNVSYREALSNKTYLILSFAHSSGSGASLGVKLVEMKFADSDYTKELGNVDVTVDGKHNAKLIYFFVKPSLRNQGYGDIMLKMVVDYLRDGTASEIHGDITGVSNLKEISQFFTKRGFALNEEKGLYGKQTMISLELTAPPYNSEFFKLHTVEKKVGKQWIPV